MFPLILGPKFILFTNTFQKLERTSRGGFLVLKGPMSVRFKRGCSRIGCLGYGFGIFSGVRLGLHAVVGLR